MTQQDYSSTAHRVENLSRHQFVQAYAMIHEIINRANWADHPISDLRVVTKVLDESLARMFDIPMTTLLGMLVDVDESMGAFKTSSGRAESGEG